MQSLLLNSNHWRQFCKVGTSHLILLEMHFLDPIFGSLSSGHLILLMLLLSTHDLRKTIHHLILIKWLTIVVANCLSGLFHATCQITANHMLKWTSTYWLHLRSLLKIDKVLSILVKIWDHLMILQGHRCTLLASFSIVGPILVKLLKLWSILLVMGLSACQSTKNCWVIWTMTKPLLRSLKRILIHRKMLSPIPNRIQDKLILRVQPSTCLHLQLLGLIALLLHLLLLKSLLSWLLTCLDRISFALVRTQRLWICKIARLFTTLILFVFGSFSSISWIWLHV